MTTKTKILIYALFCLFILFAPVYCHAQDVTEETFNELFPADIALEKQADEDAETYAKRLALFFQDKYLQLRDWYIVNMNIREIKYGLLEESFKAKSDEYASLRIKHDVLLPISNIVTLGLGGLLVWLGGK